MAELVPDTLPRGDPSRSSRPRDTPVPAELLIHVVELMVLPESRLRVEGDTVRVSLPLERYASMIDGGYPLPED